MTPDPRRTGALPPEEMIEYRVMITAPGCAQHLFSVEARIPIEPATRVADDRAAPCLELELPVWTPGSYLVREYERNLQDLVCDDGADRELPVRKVAKARWQVDLGGSKSRLVRVRYRVYAHEVTVRTCHLDETHGYWNGAAMFLYVDALRDRPARLAIEAPEGWRIATGLRPVDDAERRERQRERLFEAADYDTLVDSPVEVGPHERLDFTAAGKPHAVAIWGRAEFDRPRLVADVTAIIEEQARLFDGLPFDAYTFILHFVAGGHGGLEHRNSSTVLFTPFAFLQEKRYGDFLELISHEFFHAWNGKRIRPAALGPFDYRQENYTRSLWVVEGWTSYYDRLMLRRAGRITAARYREKLGEDLSRLARVPGRHHQSLEESSFDAWIKLYRPDENTVNTTVSYYLKGALTALCLDLEIRQRTGGARSLDDVLRLLWANFRESGGGYPDEALQPLVEQATGLRLDEFFARNVRGRGDLDLEGPLATVGLRVRPGSGGHGPGDDGREQGWLGVALVQHGDRLRVTESLEGSPAQAAHLQAGDEIVAWEGFRIDEAGVKDRLAAARPGDAARLHVFRRDELREVTVRLGRRPPEKLEVVAVPDAPEAARGAYARWMLEEWKND